MAVSSRQNQFRPPFESLVREAFERIQMEAPSLETRHFVSARMSANLILADLSANRGANLWVIGDEQLIIPCVNGVTTYACPADVVDIFDAYIRTYTPSSTTTTLGNALTPVVTSAGVPAFSANGDPMVLLPGSGVLSAVQGSQVVTVAWPQHGLMAGSPIFWGVTASIGGIVLPAFSVVSEVVDANTVTIVAPTPATFTQSAMGGTPLFGVTSGSGVVTCYLPNHGLSVGGSFGVQVETTVGGLTIPVGTYTVASTADQNRFTFDPSNGAATSSTAAFENDGQFLVSSQDANTNWTDVFMWPLSRSDYAMLPNKMQQGRPTQYWFNRTIVPSLTIWPVPDAPSATQANLYYAFVAYRMRTIEDAFFSPGQVLDMPTRIYPAFTAMLTAAMAEKYKEAAHAQKLQLAEIAWQRASDADTERVTLNITPQLSGYFS